MLHTLGSANAVSKIWASIVESHFLLQLAALAPRVINAFSFIGKILARCSKHYTNSFNVLKNKEIIT